ncbi:uncharacterized protein PFL1_02465 [Pseudozyma flocculosa PF-1]|uniref:Small ribosomal subunit protein mS29 n=2 Tax=Pseudozyma flocculosa TaxID=84751 RepID=A0A5C3F1C8_9BASI|nr:uncharacterized protein PFL1_02465 [Pseudozyma flocculosa PF-1]EPQ29792.1 hypothetical protein PFL1_02465 [Pseudozyma flocculosa PF-1]SPO37081.1 related to RSM23 - mitochondrial ribosomal protein of the small subunit [Pseudozyma flocculosa]
MASHQLARGARHLVQQAVASSSSIAAGASASTSTGTSSAFAFASAVPHSSLRCFSASAAQSAAKAKAVTPKKKSTVKKKTHTGPRGMGGPKRKGGLDAGPSASKTSEFHQDAPDMSSLGVFSSESITKAVVGKPLAWNDKALSAFKHFGLPRDLQRELAAQPRPRTLVREQTLKVLDRLDAAAKSGQTHKLVLTGSPGCGKSTLLAQSVSYALDEGWAVVYVPQAIDLINSSTTYSYSPSQLAYLQPEVTRSMISAMLQLNQAIFKRIATAEAVELERSATLEAGTTLDKVARQGIDENLNAAARQQVLDLILQTLARQTEVPVLVAVDEVQALFRTSLYRDPDYAALESYELGVPRSLLALLEGKGSFASQRLVFVGALSSTQTEYPTPTELQVALQDRAGGPDAIPALGRAAHAYVRLQQRHLANAHAAALEPVDVSDPLTTSEAAALFAQLKGERKLWSPANDELFVAKFVESAGNPRRFSRSLTSTLL